MENTETVEVHKKGNNFEIIVQHDQTGSAYGMDLSKDAYEQLRLHFVSGSVSVSWREKLRALMEGLEIEKVDDFILRAKKGDYRKLGEVMQKRIKEMVHYR